MAGTSTGSRRPATNNTANNRRTPSQSSSSKYRRTFFDERSRCFFMIVGTTGLDLAPRLEIKQLSERTGFRGVEVLLHQRESDPRTARELLRELHGRREQIGVGNHPIDHSQCEGLRRIQRLGRVVELARPAGANEFGEKVAAAKIA